MQNFNQNYQRFFCGELILSLQLWYALSFIFNSIHLRGSEVLREFIHQGSSGKKT